MKALKKIVFVQALIAAFLIAVASVTLSSSSAWSNDKDSWHQSMRKMSDGLLALMPSLVRIREIETESERAEALARSKAIAGVAHKLDKIKNAPSADPMIKFIAGDLQSDLTNSIKLMEQGQWAQGKRQMLHATQHCIGCHSLRPGPSRLSLNPDLSGLAPLQRADYFAATRQFEQAIINYEKALSDVKWASENEEKWNQAFQRLLAITVRVRNSPSLSMELISRFFDTKTYPQGLKGVAMTWRAHTKEWRKEQSVQGDSLKKATALIAQAETVQKKSDDPVGLVLYLRASGVLHQFLIAEGNSRNQEALFLAGKSAEGLRHLNFWTYPEDYYRSCTEVTPKTDWTKACEERLQSISNISG